MAVIMLAACSPETEKPARGKSPTQVTVTSVNLAETAVEYATYTARVKGVREVEVRAQSSGILLKRLYREGQHVKAGEALFQIDPEPYELAEQRAQASLDEARARLQQADQDWQRQADMFRRALTSAQDSDTAKTRKDIATAQLSKAENALLDAQRLLRHAVVKAPISGTVGMKAVSEGSLVSTDDLLSTVTQLDPVQVHFSVPSHDAERLRLAQSPGDSAVQLVLAGGQPFTDEGRLDFSDVRIDPATDRVAMRAVFSNPDHKLLTGQFVRVKVLLERYRDVALIDPIAVSEGPTGPQVYLVGTDKRAKVQAVRLGPILDGQQLVLDGLDTERPLIINGHHQLRDGVEIALQQVPGKS